MDFRFIVPNIIALVIWAGPKIISAGLETILLRDNRLEDILGQVRLTPYLGDGKIPSTRASKKYGN